jgi:ribonuclease D
MRKCGDQDSIVQIARPPGIRDSNWELRPLTKRQYTFAIEDGFVTALLFMQLVSELHNKGHGTMLNDACVE